MDFQRQGLQNALKGLWLYFRANTPSADSDTPLQKGNLYKLYQANDFTEEFDYDLKKREGKKTAKYLLEYEKDYPAVDSKISFAHFINRMSFWMATGSGKTLIIIKLIEFLGKLIAKKRIARAGYSFFDASRWSLGPIKKQGYLKLKIRDIKKAENFLTVDLP